MRYLESYTTLWGVSAKKRWYAIDYAKAIAIILVVIGHYHPDGEPQWWSEVRQVIYSFHMPIFMFASGFLYMASFRKQSYGIFLWRKFKRLMIPYFATSTIIITIKLLTQKNAFVENPVTLSSYAEMLYLPSAGIFLWFIWALWWMFVVTPLFKSKVSRIWLFVFTFIVCHIPFRATDFFCLFDVQRMYVFFMLGVMVYDHKQIVDRISSVPIFLPLLVFVATETVGIISETAYNYVHSLLPYIGIVAMMIICREINKSGSRGLKSRLAFVASYSYGIYLFHTTFMGVAKAFMNKLPLCKVNAEMIFVATALLAIICGLVFPVLLYQSVFDKSKITRKIFGIPARLTPPPTA